MRPGGAREVAGELSELMGLEHATLGPSTLHIFWDLIRISADGDAAVYLDSGAYPIGRWGVERAAAHGVPVRKFRHLDAEALADSIAKDGSRGRRIIVVADGFCPACGRAAPIGAYLEQVRRHGGHLILDDTQALGVLGCSPSEERPYGRGGGGSLCWSGVCGPEVIVVSSLAKAFGVPVAALAGSEPMIRRYEAESETRMHCSPPSRAVIQAAGRALAINREKGDALRTRLQRLVGHFRNKLGEAGLSASGGLFPVQTLEPASDITAATLHSRLSAKGVRAVLHRPRKSGSGSGLLSFILTALHSPQDIDRAIAAVRDAHTRLPHKGEPLG